jgi:hypothetical protein
LGETPLGSQNHRIHDLTKWIFLLVSVPAAQSHALVAVLADLVDVETVVRISAMWEIGAFLARVEEGAFITV